MKGILEEKTSHEMLYIKKLMLKGVPEWGEEVWVHVTNNNMLRVHGEQAK
jgi:hypothetical protein